MESVSTKASRILGSARGAFGLAEAVPIGLDDVRYD
jgi:hypothetical protein